MSMVFCRGCGKEIHESALACPSCGATQGPTMSQVADGVIWKPIVSMVLGLMASLTCLDSSQLDKDTAVGIALFATTGLVLGSISLAKQRAGKKMAITGVVSSILALICLIGALPG